MAWFPSYRECLPENFTVKDEMRLVVYYIGHDSLHQTYDETPKIEYAWRKLGLMFPKNDKGLYKIIDKLSDKDAQFLKEHYKSSEDCLDMKKWKC